jgi:signal transduction histidine kinase
MSGRAILARQIVTIEDVLADERYESTAPHAGGFRSMVGVPLLRDSNPVGVIVIVRSDPGPFTDRQIALLKTFADQAVIAIENVRLFTELQEKNTALTAAHAQVTEALEQQTATSEILRVISGSPTDIQPVLDAMAESAARLCEAYDAGVWLRDDETLVMSAHHGPIPSPPQRLPIGRDWVTGRAVVDGRPIHVHDLATAGDEFPEGQAMALRDGHRTTLATPLLREGKAIGAILIRRAEVRPFSDKHIALLKTFADQAVIAIENVRLFKELQSRTGELTRSVERLTALGEVGRAVSSTLDLETVLTTIVSQANQLLGAEHCAIYEYDEASEEFHLRATQNIDMGFVELLRSTRIRKGEGAVGQMAVTFQPTHIPDIGLDASYQSRLRSPALRAGYRAILAVPLLRENRIIGGLIVNRKAPGEFAPELVELLRTFAAQSALAIQNARLFRELADKSHQLEAASQHKSEFLANMSHELRTPLNAIIGFSEVLSDRMFGELNEKQEEYLKDIYASGQHLLSLINDILDLSKIEAGRMELELTDFDLPTAIENALMLVRERAGRRSIALHTNIDTRLGQVQADERKVRQLVLNLLSNAIKFTPGGGRIDVGAVPKDGFVEVSISDTGIGVAPEDQEKIFEEFRQVGTAAKKVEGTGLGLTLCRKFVELHGGKIWVKSQEGVGSTFTFTIPADRTESR